MKKISYLLFIVSFLILVATLFGLFINNKVLEEEAFYASVEINSTAGPGFDVSPTALTFGRIGGAGGSSTRSIFFENGYDFPVLVKIGTDGSIGPLLEYDRTVRVESGEDTKIPFSVSISEGMEDGFYSGMVRLIVKPTW